MRADLPVGEPVDWSPARQPQKAPLRGEHVLLRPLDANADAEDLFEVSHLPAGDPTIWTYLHQGPYRSVEEMRAALAIAQDSEDRLFFTVLALPDQPPSGIASYLRIEPEFGVIEIGNIWFGPPLKRTKAATEAIYLLARHAFEDLGYRRLEWKSNALNAASRRAAERFGFTLEGVFRNHEVVKGRNRDTAWYSIIAQEWPAIAGGFRAWLSDHNFDSHGRQRRPLAELIAASQEQTAPAPNPGPR